MKRLLKFITPVLLALCMVLPVSASGHTMNGVDVSNWQNGIEVDEMDMDFVITKATEGVSYVNPDCNRVYQDAVKSGKKVGVYHFASGGDALAEAKFFVNNISGYIGEVDWQYVGSAALLAGLVSILTSTVGIPEVIGAEGTEKEVDINE